MRTLKAIYLLLAISTFASILPLSIAHAQATNYFTLLTGNQEVPPIPSFAFSVGRFSFLPGDAAIVGYRINFSHDQTVTDVHIHEGAFGVDGSIILNMRPTTPTEGFCIDLAGGLITYYVLTAEALRGSLEGGTLTDLRDLMGTGGTYLNLHTLVNPSGWIRGQMVPVSP
jgi:hypothetical protein